MTDLPDKLASAKEGKRIDLAIAASWGDRLCEGCPPVGYPNDTTRCLPCPRRALQKGHGHE